LQRTRDLKEIPMASRTSIAALAVSFLAFAAQGAETKTDAASAPSPEAIVQAQLEAYNRHDLEGFLAFYADDAVLVDYPDRITQTGKAEMRARYEKRFAQPNVRAEILQRIVFANFVVDHERITWPPSTDVIEAVATYEVKDGKIVRVTFLTR
jgi:putative hydrolase of HD superfamily